MLLASHHADEGRFSWFDASCRAQRRGYIGLCRATCEKQSPGAASRGLGLGATNYRRTIIIVIVHFVATALRRHRNGAPEREGVAAVEA